jgi:Tfp pilus assembly protein PilW
MNEKTHQSGFSLIELLVAAAVFMFVVPAVSGLFIQALELQRRATGIQKIEENAQFAMESIAREVRVATITSGDTSCSPPDPITTRELVIDHPVNGTVTYRYDRGSGYGILSRNGEAITSTDVDIKTFAFCVRGSGSDNAQTRLTMPMTIESTAGRPSNRVSVSLQTTVISRDLGVDLLP